ncbi:MAG: hypothetical protein ACYTGX_18530 [Planctomycetota bacterium]|jgi:biopolymer transport protein ExbD
MKTLSFAAAFAPLLPLLAVMVSASAVADEGVIPIPLPRDEGMAANAAEEKLPIRLTLTFNIATRQAKCYIGQTFCGILGQGGLTKSKQRVRQIMATGTRVAEIDADGMVPWPIFLKAYQAMRETRLDSIAIAAPEEMPLSRFSGPAPATLDGWKAPVVPLVEKADRALTGEDKPIVVAIDHAGHFAVASAPGVKPTPLAGPAFRKWLTAEADKARDTKNPALSNRKLVFRVGAQATWRDLMVPFVECAHCGVWDLYVAVRTPTVLTVAVGAKGGYTFGKAYFGPDASDGLYTLMAEQITAAGGADGVRLKITGPKDADRDAIRVVDLMAVELGIKKRTVELEKQ